MSQKTTNYQITTNQLYLNSRHADTYMNGTYKSSLIFYFPQFIKTDKNTIATKLSVVNAQFPYSFYQLNENNNKLSMMIQTPTTNVYYDYIFPVGNYTFTSFQQTWKKVVGTDWTLTLNTLTNQITFTYNSTATFQFLTSSIFSVIGFADGIYACTSTTPNYYYIFAPFPCNFLGPLKLNLKSSTFYFRNIDTYAHNDTNIICSIPINASPGGLIQYTNFTNTQFNITNTLINSIQIDVCNEHDEYINFNNVDWSITIEANVYSENIINIDTLEDIYKNEK